MSGKTVATLTLIITLFSLGCKEGGGAGKVFEMMDEALHTATQPASPETADNQKKSGEKQDGTVKKYRKNGKLLSETEYVDGIKHGFTRSYYENGNLYSEISYENGKKQGTATWFFEDAPGQAYQETPYVDGKKQGLRKKYHNNGNLMATIPFHDDFLGKAVEEFDESGEPTSDKQPKEFKVSAENRLSKDGEYLLKLSVSPYDKKAEYYAGELTADGFLNGGLEKIPENEGTGTVTVKLKPGETINETVNFIAVTRTDLGNPLILERKFEVSVSR